MDRARGIRFTVAVDRAYSFWATAADCLDGVIRLDGRQGWDDEKKRADSVSVTAHIVITMYRLSEFLPTGFSGERERFIIILELCVQYGFNSGQHL